MSREVQHSGHAELVGAKKSRAGIEVTKVMIYDHPVKVAILR